MRDYTDNSGCVMTIIVALIGLLILAALGWDWYRAGVQADIYKRKGIAISQWEVFIGTAPAERVIQIKEHKP